MANFDMEAPSATIFRTRSPPHSASTARLSNSGFGIRDSGFGIRGRSENGSYSFFRASLEKKGYAPFFGFQIPNPKSFLISRGQITQPARECWAETTLPRSRAVR